MPETNTLAYSENLKVTAVKSFIVQAPGGTNAAWVKGKLSFVFITHFPRFDAFAENYFGLGVHF